jgi:hypothetical protein
LQCRRHKEEVGKDLEDLVVVELEVVLVRVEGPGAKVEVAVLLAPGPVVVGDSLAQNLTHTHTLIHSIQPDNVIFVK